MIGWFGLAAICYSLVSVTGHLSWLAATLVSDWWFLAAISGPPIGWLVLVAQFPSLLLVGQRLRSSQVAWWQVIYWLIFLLVAAFLWRSTWLSWMDTLAAVVWAVIGWSGGIFVELG